jgi:hypothetical protein
MKTTKIYIVSPMLSCGATWLINCFLALNVKVYRISSKYMWVEKGNVSLLHPRENCLKRQLPSLSIHNEFRFRKDIEVEWIHEWPTERTQSHKIIYFHRDLKDAIYSWYKRIAPNMSFQEYIAFPNEHTLLNLVDHWMFFTECWVAQKNVKVFRFEDYKHDASNVFAEVLDFVGFDYDLEAFERALKESTFESARQEELKYQSKHALAGSVINRKSQVGGWQEVDDQDRVVIEGIESRTTNLQANLGCSVDTTATTPQIYKPQLDVLDFFHRIDIPSEISNRSSEVKAQQNKEHVFEFIRKFKIDQIQGLGLDLFSGLKLILTLSEFLQKSDSVNPEIMCHLNKVKWDYYRYMARKMFRFYPSEWKLMARLAARQIKKGWNSLWESLPAHF